MDLFSITKAIVATREMEVRRPVPTNPQTDMDLKEIHKQIQTAFQSASGFAQHVPGVKHENR